MAQTETPTPDANGFLNDPPMGPQGFPEGFRPPPGFTPGTPPPPTPQQALDEANKVEMPTIEERSTNMVTLPGGYIDDGGLLIRTVTVRELNGYDEEKLSRFDMVKNSAKYVTELLFRAVEEIGGAPPTREIIRRLLIGDRDAIVLGIRQITYGNSVEFKLNCSSCSSESMVEIELDKDVEIKEMEDPVQRVFHVPLRHGEAEVTLINGEGQEAFSEEIGKKTQAEVTTVMLANSVIAINGVPVRRRQEDMRQLSSADRETLVEFINDHAPGPQFQEIQVACATCGAEYPISLGLPALFRF